MLTRRKFNAGVAAIVGTSSGSAFAQAKPLRIGFSIAQSGGLAAGGKSGLLAFEIWRDQVNAQGGILGRNVEIVVYDDQSNAANVPAIYAKLIDIDKVDVLMSPYGTNVAGPTIPLAKERNRLIFGMFAIGLNVVHKHRGYFAIGPWGPDAQLTYKPFFELGRSIGVKKMAILAADAEFQQTAADGGRRLAKEYGIPIVFDQRYPANTTDFSGLLQSLQSVQPDIVYVCSYPTESAAIIRGIDEIGVPDSVQLFGGGMVGIQNAALLGTLGKQLNGIVNYDTFSIEPKLLHPGAKEFLATYAQKAVAAKVDPLGYFLPPYWYAAGQIIKTAIEATKGTNDAAMSEWLHTNEIPTIVGPVRFGEGGEWAENRILMVQYQGILSKDIEQFRTPGKIVVVAPERFRSGDLKRPLSKARG